MPKSVFTDAYASVVETLVRARKQSGVSQVELASRLGKPQQFISRVERCERRLDVIEFYAYVRGLGQDPIALFSEVVDRLPADVRI